MPTDSLSPRQRQTLAARQALAAKFATPEAKSAHFRGLAERANADRVTLNADEASALGEAYALLRRIVQRHPKIADPPAPNEAPTGGKPTGEEASS